MAPSNLQGLNVVHPIPPSNPYLSDADLLSVPFPDLSAQLDLWTNLNFQSDEPLHSTRPGETLNSKKDIDGKKHSTHDEGEDVHERYNDPDDDVQRSGIAETHSHENVVIGTVLPPTASSSNSGHPPIPPFDINSLLATFGIDPFMAPPAPMPAQAPSPANTIAQLLSLHASSFRPGPSQSIPPSDQSAPAQSPPQQQSQASSPASPATTPTTNKRARTARNSVSVPSVTVESPQAESPEEKASTTPLNASEDKRRRNTAASARFRLKKKEREAALERKAKELEVRVSELEKECEALRRENGWLKGLVVGVTGAGAVQQQQSQIQQQHQQSASPPPLDSAGVKRPREEDP